MSKETGRKRGRPRKLNLYEKNDGWYTGQLLHGKTFQIDKEDYEKVRLYTRHHQFVWRNSQPAKQLHNPMVTLHQCRSSGA